MLAAGDDDAHDVQDDEAQRQTDGRLMGGLNPRHAPERIGGHHESGGADDREHDQERHDHRPAGGVVAQIALGSLPCGIAQIARNGARSTHEIRKARMPRADEAPENSEGDQADHGVARHDVHLLDLIARYPGKDEGCDQAPVKNADKRIPYLDLGLPRGRLGAVDRRQVRTHRASPPVVLPARRARGIRIRWMHIVNSLRSMGLVVQAMNGTLSGPC
jgi:hypothetical protein